MNEIDEWFALRAHLSHDVLANKMLVTCLALKNRLDMGFNTETMREDMHRFISLWKENAPSFPPLFETCEQKTSPKTLLSTFPLTTLNPEDRDRLKKLVHARWLSLYAIHDNLNRANNTYAQLDGLMLKLEKDLMATEQHSASLPKSVSTTLAEIHQTGRAMCTLLGILPKSILV